MQAYISSYYPSSIYLGIYVNPSPALLMYMCDNAIYVTMHIYDFEVSVVQPACCRIYS